ncbi:MAG: hypothetical protein HY059_21550 [Proteobacteria bacterium]|nr:hypothetical protein [Pseudomonadota bacterium]
MRIACALLLGLTLLVPPARADELVVVEAKGVDLAPGAKVDGTKVLQLAAGQRLTLVAADGRTVKLRGPYEEAPAPAAGQVASMGDALKNLMSQRGSGTAQLGVVRAAGDAVELPEPWIVDVGRSGARCLLADASPVLWGPKFAAVADLAIEPADRSWRARGQWPAGTDRLSLPSRIPLADGGSYVFDVGGNPANLTIYRMPAGLASPVLQAAWMIEKGCEDQARALVREAQR